MNAMRALLSSLVVGSALWGTAAQADFLLTTTGALTAADPIQEGRISRDGESQNWAGDKVYPGIFNATTRYNYTTFQVDVGETTFIQIDFDSLSANTFVSAWLGGYNPLNLASGDGWLGDPGNSGNFFSGTDPEFFSFVAPANSTITVVVNQTAQGAGLGDPFTLIVEAYCDRLFTSSTRGSCTNAPPPGVPEPGTLWLATVPLALLAGRRFLSRRQR